ncbi:hypothetical protein CXG81DRAFT_23381 [Caulochytrium protostelioides]|uniref:RING-type domain-containing protein n=1 Tax=Caulochytrium protostelioides TaxID=1555241 RepID=A0A4P9XEL8_9FUNG|nr:hypothetical protein CXG81DRAFT_23381 [Caulochytrium protostelioides]|eukprot:RKP03968.1 hypothetical protein CXG81DRAFT_23381 [Caulochytrium protostelioides]
MSSPTADAADVTNATADAMIPSNAGAAASASASSVSDDSDGPEAPMPVRPAAAAAAAVAAHLGARLTPAAGASSTSASSASPAPSTVSSTSASSAPTGGGTTAETAETTGTAATTAGASAADKETSVRALNPMSAAARTNAAESASSSSARGAPSRPSHSHARRHGRKAASKAHGRHGGHAGASRPHAGGWSPAQLGLGDDASDEFYDELESHLTGEGSVGRLRVRANRRGETSITHLLQFQLPAFQRAEPGAKPGAAAAASGSCGAHAAASGAASQATGAARRRVPGSHGDRRGPLPNGPPGAGGGRHGSHHARRPLSASDKPGFVDANYQFVLRDSGDYGAYLSDPDLAVIWSDVVQVQVPNLDNAIHCPICLDEPKAPKVGRCGHVFCWSCILHYLSHADGKAIDCPVCHAKIRSDELKSVRLQNRFSKQSVMATGPDPSPIEMTLMKRSTGSTVAVPVAQHAREAAKQAYCRLRHLPEHPPAIQEALAPFCRLLVCDPGYHLTEILDKEARELAQLLAAEQQTAKQYDDAIQQHMATERRKMQAHTPAVAARLANELFGSIAKDEPFIEHAIALLEAQREQVAQQCAARQAALAAQRDAVLSVPEAAQDWEAVLAAHVAALPPSAPRPKVPGASYFYRAADGQALFLHPLDLKLLREQFGVPDNWPPTLFVPALTVTDASCDAALRRTSAALATIPLGCDVSVVEADWRGILDDSLLDQYAEALQERHDRVRQHQAEAQQAQAAVAQQAAAAAAAAALKAATRPPLMPLDGSAMNAFDQDLERARLLSLDETPALPTASGREAPAPGAAGGGGGGGGSSVAAPGAAAGSATGSSFAAVAAARREGGGGGHPLWSAAATSSSAAAARSPPPAAGADGPALDEEGGLAVPEHLHWVLNLDDLPVRGKRSQRRANAKRRV